MRLWSIQPLQVLETLQSGQSVYASWSRTDPDFLAAYKWLAPIMSKRLGPPLSLAHAPLWSWVQCRGPNSPRPDLRVSGHVPKGEQAVRLELEIDKARLLVSDFTAWHCVLNNSYLPTDKQDDDNWDRSLVLAGLKYGDLLSEDLQFLLHQSWERIFTPEVLTEYVTSHPSSRALQATCWSFEPSDLRSYTVFKGR